MKLLDKMERKFGRYAIHNLMYYIIVLQIVGYAISVVAPEFMLRYLTLDIGAVMHGQVWRLVTFIIVDFINLSNPFDLLLKAISLYLYYMIGKSLENVWGAFRFNLYYLSGIVFNIIAAFILYFVFRNIFGIGLLAYFYRLTYINNSLFLAFACIFPNVELLYMFLIPIKMKYLGILSGVMIGADIINALFNGNLVQVVVIIVALLNFIIFFLSSRSNKSMYSSKDYKRKKKYKEQIRNVERETRHRCAVCGRTEQDDPNLEFRFCSRCDGNYEYCMEHLFTHEHVKKH